MNNTTLAMTNSGEFLGIPAAALPDPSAHEFEVASFTLLFWDILLNFDRELTYIWKSKFSYSNILFGVIRLLVTMAEIVCLLFNVVMWRATDSGCNFNYCITAVIWLIIATCVDILLLFRVYVIYGKKKVLLWSLCVMEGVAFLAVACLIGILIPKTQSVANPLSGQLSAVVCVILSSPNITPYALLPVLFIQTTLFVLAFGRHIYLKKSGLTLSNATSHIYHTFIRDGVWIFFVLLAGILLYIIGFYLDPILSEIALFWSYSITGLSASHLIINLRFAIHEAEERSLPTSLSYTKLSFINGAVLNESVRTESSHENL